MSAFDKLAGPFDRDKMRIDRIKDFLKHNMDDEEEMKADDSKIDQDEVKFLQLHLENSCPKYHMYFGDYDIDMFQKLCPFMLFKQYSNDEKIFSKEEKCKYFYFILKGSVHLLEPTAEGSDKIARLHHENEIFGFNKWLSDEPTPVYNRDAISETTTNLIAINRAEYEKIKSNRVLNAAETKIEFLTRYIPGFRSVDQKVIQELETLFQKEKVTKGYRLLEQNKPNDCLYFILSGEWRILYNYNTNIQIKNKFDSLDESMPGFILIGSVKQGDCFGQMSAVSKSLWKYSIQAASDEVVLYKIQWSIFYDNFGKDVGTPVKQMKAKAIMDKNWINSVIKRLSSKPIEKIMSDCEFVDKAHDWHAIRSIQNEPPYLK